MDTSSSAFGMSVALLSLALIFALIIFFTWSKLKKAKSADIVAEPGGGQRVPLVAAFAVVKKLPWWSIAYNNGSPKLVLHDDRVEYRVLRTKHRPYDEIRGVDLRTTLGTVSVILHFSSGGLSFAGNTANRQLAAEVLSRLAEKGCPLSPKAQALIDAV